MPLKNSINNDIPDQGADCYTRGAIQRARGDDPKGSWYVLRHKKGKENAKKNDEINKY